MTLVNKIFVDWVSQMISFPWLIKDVVSGLQATYDFMDNNFQIELRTR